MRALLRWHCAVRACSPANANVRPRPFFCSTDGQEPRYSRACEAFACMLSRAGHQQAEAKILVTEAENSRVAIRARMTRARALLSG